MKKITSTLFLAALALCMTACKDDETEKPNNDGTSTSAYVLCEGSWGENNASMALVDLSNGKATTDWFAAKNGRGLGDVAQDLVAYGSKLYATVTFSNSLEVINPKTGESTRIDMGNRNPRYIAADGGKLYVSCYEPHSVVRIDTASLQIEATCQLGDFNPEGVAVAGGKLYVASSFISDASYNYSYDNKVYVIDLASFANPTPIEVGYNPQKVKALADGRVVVNYWGDYNENFAGSAIINGTSVSLTGQELTDFDVYGNAIYGYATTYDADWNASVGFVKVENGLVSTILENATMSSSPYGIAINPSNGDIFVCTDGNYIADGDVYCFAQNGSLRWNAEVGMLPKRVVVR